MVTLTQVKASNALLSTSLPNLVAVFVGATSGIGEYSLKAFAKHALAPRVYIVGRSQASGDRLTTECKQLNPGGTFNFIQAEVSLISAVDVACEEIRRRERSLNILFNSAGSLVSTDTPDGLPQAIALGYYTRTRFMLNLLPLLRAPSPSSLRRCVTTLCGGKEGAVDVSDFPGRKASSLMAARGHAGSMVSLSLARLALEAPDVAFIHNFPGMVQTAIADDLKGVGWAAGRLVMKAVGRFICMPNEECGERHLFLMTSGRFGSGGVAVEGIEGVKGMDGVVGSGCYSVTQEGESTGEKVVELLEGLKEEGVQAALWSHTMGV
ncbi:NAD(P)-binding protein [Mytilinidion resinicola]|uniref:NAD(P)-binding protein n=1 Tax=Mytilinidion resinicola TaxID=574789 RepID=A0A6A6YIW1_9PEZI|nr:NAD(P)-binding protein [Mytilinidion resinicola]KAF2807934.1 NAD(P)-binding protein [Mytilinidion resinicola]